ncbi:MAG: FAD-dependent oxidoreductase [Lachnospiraceae bacterium]|nr:FAD-dependent oxidoreductase [Lachnospiraceae bacterium]
MNKTILEPSNQIPVIDECDVAVIGGGIGGISAALAAARNGAKTYLVDKEICLGGLATMGLVVVYLPLDDGKGNQLTGGIGEELIRNSLKYGPGKIPDCWNPGGDPGERKKKRFRAMYNAASFMISVEELLVDAGVKISYDCRFSNVHKEGAKIDAVILESKEGRIALGCKAVVDATGDADVCVAAGEETVAYRRNIRTAWFYSYDGADLKLHQLTDEMYNITDEQPLYEGVRQSDIFRFNYDGRQMIMDKVREMNKTSESPVYPAIIPSYSEFLMTRRLRSKFELGYSQQRTVFEDSIGMCNYWLKKGHLYYIPLSALTAKHTGNLITAGRCISVDDKLWDVTRVIPVCAVTGEAAGTASAMAAAENLSFHDLDVGRLKDTLRGQGAIIDPSLKDA